MAILISRFLFSLNTFAVAANESGGNARLLLALRILNHCPFERHCNVV